MARYAAQTQKLLRSIPGVGAVTAAALVAYIGDIRRFTGPEKLVAYIGLDCQVHESGTSIHGKGYITKAGQPISPVRPLQCRIHCTKEKCSPLGEYLHRKMAEGKHYYSALCAVERKLVHIIYAVWKHGTPFEKR